MSDQKCESKDPENVIELIELVQDVATGEYTSVEEYRKACFEVVRLTNRVLFLLGEPHA